MLYDKSSIILYYLVFNLLYSLALSPANFRPSHFSTFIMAARNVGNHMSTYYTYPKAHHKFLKHSASESLSKTSHIYRLIVILYANSYFPRYLGVYLCISGLYLYVGNGNKAAVRNEMLSFLWSCKVTSSGPMECPLLYNG